MHINATEIKVIAKELNETGPGKDNQIQKIFLRIEITAHRENQVIESDLKATR